jgi:hypothetical protein
MMALGLQALPVVAGDEGVFRGALERRPALETDGGGVQASRREGVAGGRAGDEPAGRVAVARLASLALP